ncbi:hypothetical protein AVEN_30138-1 [Araneus ventricosus]|uniref:RNase H type-1 domain-containing protein n=1 Tax=Araneus ventricosus TaxID=182803 RepID=A0A4Y2MBH2_ARAVE|nr:hypothetical protein AVEN_30138-1 [Araneus ventricosus]
MDQYQHLCRIAGKTWGINKNIRRLLYKTVTERTLCHGEAAWGHNMASRLQKKLDSIQRLLLLYITDAYTTPPTAGLQVVTGLQPLHLQIQQEATYARVARARSSSNFFTVIFSPTDYERKSSGIHIHPPNFLLHNQISFAENHIDSVAKAIYTDGSKTDEGTGSAYCILENYGIIASWQGKLDRNNSVFQAEILTIRMAIKAASSLHRPIKIWTDSLSSLVDILNPKSHHSMVREIQTLLLSHKHIHLRWLKAHVGYLGNECADQLAKEAITKGNPFLLSKPLSYRKAEIKSAALSIWQDNWDNGETGRSTHDIVPRVSNKPVEWNREEIMFVTGHGPFPSYLHRCNLRTHDNCSCGEKGDPIHCATKCRFTVSCHFQTPTVSLKLQWYSTHDIMPRVSNKPVGWNREEIMFVTGHGPFPSYLHRFNLQTHDNCSCGEKGDPIHYATKCRFTLSWHFQTPTVSLKLQWLKNILTNIFSRTRLRPLMRFICDENNLIVEDNN